MKLDKIIIIIMHVMNAEADCFTFVFPKRSKVAIAPSGIGHCALLGKCDFAIVMNCLLSALSKTATAQRVHQQRRFLTAQQASALRPFYFAVHPDRFAQDPTIRVNNEKALQVFNGYLSELFPRPNFHRQSHIQVEFTVRSKDNTLKQIRISLSGNAEHIIRSALEKCNLSTEHLPKATSLEKADTLSSETSNNSIWSADGLETVWQDLQEKERLRRRAYRSANLFSNIFANRAGALQRMKSHRHMIENIQDEIEHIKRLTGSTQILWTINWEQSHMRRCLLNVQTMIGHADRDVRETIVHALNGRKLIFGRGSYICCDGSLQFGADDASGAWQKVCVESTVRRFDLRNLELLVERVKEALGDAELVVQPYGNVIIVIQQMQSFIGRLFSQPKVERVGLRHLISPGLSVEIVNAYCELMLLDGYQLQIPCNVDFAALKQFLVASSARSQQMRQEHLERRWKLELARDLCCRTLGLASLHWDSNVPFETLLECMRKLHKVDADRVEQFAQLEIHLSTSPKMFVMVNGRISIPVEWIQEL